MAYCLREVQDAVNTVLAEVVKKKHLPLKVELYRHSARSYVSVIVHYKVRGEYRRAEKVYPDSELSYGDPRPW